MIIDATQSASEMCINAYAKIEAAYKRRDERYRHRQECKTYTSDEHHMFYGFTYNTEQEDSGCYVVSWDFGDDTWTTGDGWNYTT